MLYNYLTFLCHFSLKNINTSLAVIIFLPLIYYSTNEPPLRTLGYEFALAKFQCKPGDKNGIRSGHDQLIDIWRTSRHLTIYAFLCSFSCHVIYLRLCFSYLQCVRICTEAKKKRKQHGFSYEVTWDFFESAWESIGD